MKSFALLYFQFNLTHRINHLSFGVDYPGQINPLDRAEQTADKGMYYFVHSFSQIDFVFELALYNLASYLTLPVELCNFLLVGVCSSLNPVGS
jgi:Endoplasmic reticulum vesicle transporter